MATLTGRALLDQVLESTGATVSELFQEALATRLQAAIDAGITSNLALASVLGANAQILATVPDGEDPLDFLVDEVADAKVVIDEEPGEPDFLLTADDAGEIILLTPEDDVVVAEAGSLTGTTIIDQGGIDTLTATLTAALAGTTVIKDVEDITFDWNAFGTATVDAANITGATSITVTSSKLGYLGNTKFDNVGDNTVVAGEGAVGAMDVNGGTEVVVDAGAAKTVTVDGTGTAADDLSATVTAGAATETINVGAVNGFTTTTIIGGAATTAITVNGNGTSDVVDITVENDVTIDVTTSAIETLNITAADGNEVTLTAGALLDEVTVTSDGEVTLAAVDADLDTHTLTNATAGLTIALDSSAGADLSDIEFDLLDFKQALAGDITVASGAAMNADVDLTANKIFTGTGTTDTATLNLSVDQTLIDVVDGTNDIETLNITTSLAAADVDDVLTIAQLDAVDAVISGADDVALTLFNAESIDASAVTGDFSAIQDTAAATTVVGSSTGDNDVTFTADAQDVGYTGGDGKDTVVMAQTTGNSTVVLGNGVNNYTNTTLTDGTAVVLGGAGVDTITVTATDSGANTANVVIQSGGGADDVTLSLVGADETADLDLGDGDDTLTIGSNTSAGDTLVVDGGLGTDTVDLAGFDISAGSITFANIEVIDDSDGAGVVDAALLTGESYIIKGDGSLATQLDVAVGTAGSYDFSNLVLDATLADGIGGLNITGNAGNDTIIGTDGADTIATGGGDDNITGGQGADDITLGAGTDTVVITQGDTGITATTIDSIDAFTTTTDKLKLGTAATATNYVELADADYALDFSATKTAADASLDGTVKYVFAGDTDAGAGGGGATGFLFIDYDMDGTSDAAVELVGLQAGTFEMGDIIA